MARPNGVLCWVHAASVGETNAVLPVIEALGNARPDLNFLLTTGTVTSAGLAERRLGPRAVHQYVPLDAPEYAARFLDHWQPDLAVFTESEIWPSLILATSARNIPIALVNGRLSHRSRRRWQRNKSTAVPLFGRFNIILAQNERLAIGFSALGARNVHSVGNLKIDAPPPPIDLNELERLKAALAGRPVFTAASTHEGEEEPVAAAHRALDAPLREPVHHHRAAPSRARHGAGGDAQSTSASRWRSARSAPCRDRARTSTSPIPSASSARSTRCRPSPSSAAR